MATEIIYKGVEIKNQKNPYLKAHASYTVDGLTFGPIERIKREIDQGYYNEFKQSKPTEK